MHTQLKFWMFVLMALGFLQIETLAMEIEDKSSSNLSTFLSTPLKKEENEKGNTSRETKASSVTIVKNEETTFILSIDGGGIRGLIPARILARIEEDLENKYGQSIRLAHLFDVMSGTSTGGIITLGLTAPVKERETDLAPGYPAKKLVELYKERGAEIFPVGGPAWWEDLKTLFKDRYDPRPLEKLLDGYFHEHELRETTTRVIIPAHELNTNVTYVFDSKEADVGTKNYKMKDVARATSAAPTYFSAATIKNKNGDEKIFVDGGLTLNNPTEIALEKARKNGAKKFFIISLGTGEAPRENLAKLKEKGAASWASPTISLMMSAASKFVDERLVSEKERAKENGLEVEYLRIQPIINSNVKDLDTIAPENIKSLEGYADLIFDGHEGENSYKCSLLRNKMEERLIERGITPKGTLAPRIYLKLLQLTRTKKLILEGADISTSILKDISTALSNRYGSGLSFSTLKLLNTSIDNSAIPIIVNKVLKPYKVKRLVLDGSTHIGTGVSQLHALLKHPSEDLILSRLSLQNTGIIDETAYLLATLPEENPTIKEIRLGKNKLSEQAIKELSGEKIRFEDLSENFDSENDEENKKK